ncbi:FecR family protein [Algoriphagus aquimarinus]|uniref:FecR protein n=1 Tax=Algoriphagus aquimarinus TaxID=237018 RepID=A0A1I0YUY2_9BACT|nr:FecR family protein [Algoriphagus aquimarinus]SFB17205.1 FecR protein [Algoriphagus aquimarinus]
MDKNRQFEDFFDGKMPESDAKVFCAWLNTEEGTSFLDSKINSDWNSKRVVGDYADWNGQSLLDKINVEKVKAKTRKLDSNYRREVHRTTKRHIPSWVSVAAIVTLVILVPLVFFKLTNTPEPTQQELPSKVITRSNPSGVKSKFQLPDGSLVSLNSESSVVYQEDFAVNRNIELIGEAYITVAKDSLHPFIIKSLGLNTEALGTIFNIKAYENENSVEVLLVEGKVKVDKGESDEALILLPGEKAVLTSSKGGFEKRKGDVRRDTQWTEGVLEFRNLGFKEIFKRLERWYGVKIEVKGSLSTAKGLGKFQEGETLENVLDVLSYSTFFKYEINKDTVYVDFTRE